MGSETPVIGSCMFMCPSKEMKWREKNKLLHVLEIKHGTEADPKVDPEKAIKEFSRSAAGKIQSSPSDLRPSNILLKTMNYLVNKIVSIEGVPWVEVYNFVNDRIQAIRQDITIQMIEDENSLQIYEKCIRFYIISSYILCEELQSRFDQFLNKQQLCICLEKLINLYQKFQSDAMNEFISIHFCLNVNNCEKIYRHEILFKEFFKDDLVKLTLRTCIAWVESNFIRFFSCVKRLPVMLQIMFFHNFGFIRKKALKILSIAYSSTACHLPVEVLSQWMCLPPNETLLLCERFKIKVKEKYILFHKKDFVDSEMSSLKKESLIDEVLKDSNKSSLINREASCQER